MTKWHLTLAVYVLALAAAVAYGVRTVDAQSSGRDVARGAWAAAEGRYDVEGQAVLARRPLHVSRPDSSSGRGQRLLAAPVSGSPAAPRHAQTATAVRTAGASRPVRTVRYYRQALRGQVKARRVRERTILRLRRDMQILHKRLKAGRRLRGVSYSPRYAIHLAAVTWRQSEGDLLRVAECESPGLDATLVNLEPIYNGEHATGLFQFIPSTWASTPYAGEDIFDPIANSLAAGWMWANGRRREWACQ